MKLFKATPLLSYIIILSLIFTSVLPAFAQETAADQSLTDATEQLPVDSQYDTSNPDSIAYDDSVYEITEERPLPEIESIDITAEDDAADNGDDDTFELMSEEAAEEVSAFTDVSHMSDEVFFGVWDQESETWTTPGKLNYDYSPDLAEVERLVKLNSYTLAKEALLEYYRSRKSIPRADFDSGIGWARNTLNSRDAYSFQETYLSYTNITSVGEYDEYTVDLGKTDASVFLLSSITKTQDMVAIASRETEYVPTLEILREDKSTVTLTPVRDTYIRAYDDVADYSTRIYGDAKELYVKDSWYQKEDGRYMPYSSKTRRAYIAFDPDKIPGDVENVYLKFYAKIVPEEGVEHTTETNHEILVFNAYNKSWSEVEGENGKFAPMTWADYRIAHYSWNGLPGGFDWIKPDNVPSEFFNENTRFQGAVSLAKSSLLTGNVEHMQRSMEITLDFIQDTNGKIEVGSVPAGRDIESANRCVETPGLFAGYLDSDLFNAEAMTAILKWLWEEMTYLYNGAGILYEGATAIPTSNNYAETNRGLWHVKGTQGVCAYFPEYADRDKWKELSDERLDVVSHVLVNDDGCYQEPTFSYAASMIGYFLAIYRYLQDSGEEIPEWYIDRVGKFAKYMMYMSYPNHVTPYMGEGGAPNTTSSLNKYLALVDDEEIEYAVTDGAEGVMPEKTAAYFEALKIVGCRTGWSTKDSMLVMNAKNGGNHNHKDSLMITFYAGDKELLADTGMTSYDSQHPHYKWQRHTTRSHNTIEIDGIAQRGSNFLGNSNPNQENGDSSLVLYHSSPVDRIVAWTDANKGFRHHRNVSYIKNHNFIIVSDMVHPEDSAEHTYTQNWHTYASDPSYATIDNTTKIGRTNYTGGSNIIIAQANGDNLELTLEEGLSSYSPNPTDYFCYTQRAAGDIMYNTVLYPTQTGTSSDIGIKNIDTGVDPAIASAMDINLFKDNDDVLNVFYYNSFEEMPAERTFNGYTTDTSNVTIQQDVDGIPSFLSMYNGSKVIRDGEELIVSDIVLEDIEIVFDGDKAEITSKDANINSAKLIFKAPSKIRKLTINGENTEYIYSDSKVYINRNEAVDFAADNGYFVNIIAADAAGRAYPFTVDIPASSVTSGTLAMPQVAYADGTFTVSFGSAVLSSCAKLVAGGHTSERVTATIGGSAISITTTIPLGSGQQYADGYVTAGAPVLERGREDLVIWTKDVTDFVIGASTDADYGEDYEEEFVSGSGGGGADVKPLPKAEADIDTETKPEDTQTPENNADEAVFADCIGHWGAEDIAFMHKNGYVKGMSETSFAPDNNVTRAEFAAMAVRVLGVEEAVYGGAFADVSADDWYAGVVEAAYKAGIIFGSDGLFRPNDNITREEMAVILMRVYRIGGEYTAEGEAEFADSADISSWAAEAINSACELGLINGMGDGTFAPYGNTTRAQAATVLRRLLDKQQVKEG